MSGDTTGETAGKSSTETTLSRGGVRVSGTFLAVARLVGVILSLWVALSLMLRIILSLMLILLLGTTVLVAASWWRLVSALVFVSWLLLAVSLLRGCISRSGLRSGVWRMALLLVVATLAVLLALGVLLALLAILLVVVMLTTLGCVAAVAAALLVLITVEVSRRHGFCFCEVVV